MLVLPCLVKDENSRIKMENETNRLRADNQEKQVEMIRQQLQDRDRTIVELNKRIASLQGEKSRLEQCQQSPADFDDLRGKLRKS